MSSTASAATVVFNDSHTEADVLLEDDEEGGGNAHDALQAIVAWKGSLYRKLVPVLLCFCLVAIITNLAILISVRWIRRSLSPTLCFSVSLAVADAYASVFLAVGLLFNSLLPIGYDVHLVSTACFVVALECFRMAGLIVSVLHLLLLAVNHYIGILRPLHYASTVTRRNAMLNIGLLWLFPHIFFVVYFYSMEGEGFQSVDCQVFDFMLYRKYRLLVGCLFFVPLVLMLFIYVHIFVIVMQHNRGLQQFQQQPAPGGGCRTFRHNVKAATTTLVILVTYTFGWMPAVLLYVLVCIDCAVDLSRVSQVTIIVASLITNALIVLKLVINPIIYAARMKDIRVALRRMMASCGFPALSTATAKGRSLCSRTTDGGYEASNSSFSRSRNATIGTSIRLHSIYRGSKTSGHRAASGGLGTGGVTVDDSCTPILIHSGSTKSRAISPPDKVGEECGIEVNHKQNGLLKRSLISSKTYLTTGNSTTTCLIEP